MVKHIKIAALPMPCRCDVHRLLAQRGGVHL